MPVYGPNLDIGSNYSWDFLLVADMGGEKAQYNPKSDASLRINKFPHLVLELNSDSSESDRIRMLLQAACLARLGDALSPSVAPPFIVSAVYIDEYQSAKWHFVYQPRGSNTVGLILQEAVRYLCLGRLDMWCKTLILKMLWRRSISCFSSTTWPRWLTETMVLYNNRSTRSPS